MKVIAHLAGDSYLVEAHRTELNEISGGTLSTPSSHRYNDGKLLIGTQFKVGSAWARLRDLRDRAESLHRTAGTMRALADMLESQLDVIEPLPVAAGYAPPPEAA